MSDSNEFLIRFTFNIKTSKLDETHLQTSLAAYTADILGIDRVNGPSAIL